MLREDLKFVVQIWRRKSAVARKLAEHSLMCAAGGWRIEGPYAIKSNSHIPSSLENSIRGIRRRQSLRTLVERLLPPWHYTVHNDHASHAPVSGTICYLSNGGQWKIFDLSKKLIWSTSSNLAILETDAKSSDAFRAWFNIPKAELVVEASHRWKVDQFLPGTNLSLSSSSLRQLTFEKLVEQYTDFWRTTAIDPHRELTKAAIAELEACAPNSPLLVLVRQMRDQIDLIGSSLPLAPAHCDLSGQNILLFENQPWIIDWGGSGSLWPIFYDLMYLMIREAMLFRSDLLEHFLDGSFDGKISRALPSSLHLKQLRSALLVHAALMHFYAVLMKRGKGSMGEYIAMVTLPIKASIEKYKDVRL